MKYSIDRIEENKMILENIKTKEKKTVTVSNKHSYKEGMILIERNGKLIESLQEERKRRSSIKRKLNKVKKTSTN